MTSCASELLFLKYRGISAPWEVTSDAKRIGYKCKKYSKWNDVLVEEDSADTLQMIGDSLLDSGEFPIQHYAHFARIWERVQRWAKDKEGFSLEPDFRPEFDRLARLMTIGAGDAGLVDSVLADAIGDVCAISTELRWDLFKQVVLLELLRSSKATRTLLGSGLPEVEAAATQAGSFAASVDTAVIGLYEGLGFTVSSESVGDGAELLLSELGLPTEATSLARRANSRPKGPPPTVVEVKARSDLRLMEVVMVAGTLVIKFNDRHPAMLDGSPFQRSFEDRKLWRTFGLACRDQLGQLEEIQSLLDAWGVHLAQSTRRESD